MALIVITIRDMEDGTVAVQLQDEPKVRQDHTEFSAAQHIGAVALNAIHAQLNDIGKNTIDLSAAPSVAPGKRKLTIVGADEMPL
jgi:hypothetical protein